MIHKVDIYKKVYNTDETGQHVGYWLLVKEGQECYATPTGATSLIRIQPTMEGIDFFTMSFPFDVEVGYDTRFKNLRSKKYDEVFYESELQVIKFSKYPSYTGKVTYTEITAKTVIE